MLAMTKHMSWENNDEAHVMESNDVAHVITRHCEERQRRGNLPHPKLNV